MVPWFFIFLVNLYQPCFTMLDHVENLLPKNSEVKHRHIPKPPYREWLGVILLSVQVRQDLH